MAASLDTGFIGDLGGYIEDAGKGNANTALAIQRTQHQKFKHQEARVLSRREFLQRREVELQKAADGVQVLKQKADASEDAVIDYSLANIMLEHTLTDAEELLSTKLQEVRSELGENTDAWSLLRDALTTTEVNMSRLHNFDVARRKGSKLTE